MLAEGVGPLKAAALCFAVSGACHDAKLVSKFPFCCVPGLVVAHFPLLKEIGFEDAALVHLSHKVSDFGFVRYVISECGAVLLAPVHLTGVRVDVLVW